MHYYLQKNGAGLLMNEWTPFVNGLNITFENAPTEGVVRITNNGRAYIYSLRNGECIVLEHLDGECHVTVETRDKKQRWNCESIVVEEKDGVKIVKGINLRKVVADLRVELASIKEEFGKLKSNMVTLTKKVDYTVDGHDFV